MMSLIREYDCIPSTRGGFVTTQLPDVRDHGGEKGRDRIACHCNGQRSGCLTKTHLMRGITDASGARKVTSIAKAMAAVAASAERCTLLEEAVLVRMYPAGAYVLAGPPDGRGDDPLVEHAQASCALPAVLSDSKTRSVAFPDAFVDQIIAKGRNVLSHGGVERQAESSAHLLNPSSVSSTWVIRKSPKRIEHHVFNEEALPKPFVRRGFRMKVKRRRKRLPGLSVPCSPRLVAIVKNIDACLGLTWTACV
jgi:hypothetical protein